MRRSFTICIALCAILILPTKAQQTDTTQTQTAPSAQAGFPVEGKVIALPDSIPLGGVQVSIMNAQVQATTDSLGAFKISANSPQDTLLFVMQGYQKKGIPLKGIKTVGVILTPEPGAAVPGVAQAPKPGEKVPTTNPPSPNLSDSTTDPLDTAQIAVTPPPTQGDTTKPVTAVAASGAGKGKVTGIVTDASTGEPLPGVSVQAGAAGAMTDTAGIYSISLANPSDSLVFSFVGYATQRMTADGKSKLDIVLGEDKVVLNEVVVVGYGTMNRSTLSSSVSTIGSESIENERLPSVTQALQAKAGGVQVTQNSGTPGGGVSVRVRGTTSINASSEPLYVIDGVPVSSNTNFTGAGGFDLGGAQQGVNPLSSINPNDIESVEVLKDAAASAIYGARAANGVVLITTKRGKSGSSQITLSTYAGVSQIPRERRLSLMNTDQYVDYMRDVYGYLNQTPPESVLRTDVNTNWQNELFRTAPLQSYELSASGGSEKTQYYLSLGYYDQEGTIQNSGFDRLGARLNLDHQHSEKLKFTTSLNISQTTNRRIQEEDAREATIRFGLVAPPNNPVYNDDGSYFFDPIQANRENPMAWLKELKNEAQTFRMTGNVSADYKILPSLTFRTNWGIDLVNIKEDIFLPPNNVRYLSGIGQGISRITRDQIWLNENTLTFDKKFGNHNLNVVVGNSVQASNSFILDARRTGFPGNDVTTLPAGGTLAGATSQTQEWAIASFFGRANYTLKDRYILTGNFRVDGSSRFGVNSRYGTFPSFAAAWRVSEESFFEPLKKVVNNFKVRASWGITGNQEIPPYASYSLYTAANNSYINQPGFVPTTFGDSNLSWETTKQTNIGLDLGFLDGRISVLADYYVKNTSDLLISVQIPATSGFATAFTNIGEMQNKGFEFELTTKNLVGEFSWNTSLNMSFNQNKVVSLPYGKDLFAGIGNFNIAREGEPLGTFFGWQMAGVNPNTGMIDFYKADGTVGRPTDPLDRQIIGNPNPTFFGGISNTFFYKGFDLSILGQFNYGNDIYNYTAFYRFHGGADKITSNGDVAWTRRWQQPGDITDMPRPTPGNFENMAASTRWVENGSFLRIRNVTLGYSFPQNSLEKLHIASLRLYASVQNAYVFTKYNGFDPEVKALATSGIALGTDHSNYPQPRIFTGGLILGF